MPELRLVGDRLRAVRALAENPLTRRALWAAVSADFRVAELAALAPADRSRVEEVPRPLAGAAPRRWGPGDQEHPVAVGSAAELCAAYRDRRCTPTEVAERVLARLDANDFGESTYSPFVAVDREGFLAAAAESTARYAAGESRGCLDGVPVPVKDEFHLRGLPTRGGTSWRNETVDEDAFIVTRLRGAGALLVGKAHATEDGMNPLGFNPNFDYPRNVYSSGHGAGGSSTGSAVSVGLGLAPVAIGTDGGGSIRVPAAMNGLFGLKPTFNRLGMTGGIWLGTVGHAGPIGRSVSDLVDLLCVCAARDPDDPKTHFANDWDGVYDQWRAALGRGIAGCRIGVLHGELRDAAPAIARACEEALRQLEREGAKLIDCAIPLATMANAVGPLVIAGDSAANASDDLAAHREETSDEVRLVYALMECVTAQQYLRASRTRMRIREQVAATMEGFDLLALPTHARLASPYALDENRLQIADTAWTAAMTRFSFLGNLTGLPAVSVPVGMQDGLPMGLQLVGDAYDEASVIAGAAHLERLGVADLPRPSGYRSLLG